MNTRTVAGRAAGVAVLLALAVGCGGGLARPTVQGSVTYKGTPVGNKTLTLCSQGAEKADCFSQMIALRSDGTFAGEVPIPGQYKVVIAESMATLEGQKPANAKSVKLPTKYRDAATSDLTWTIVPGLNQRALELVD